MSISRPELPDSVALPLAQHIGVPAAGLKSRGDEVSVGELIGEMGGPISARVHSPVAGKIKRIVAKPLPGGRMVDHVEIAVDKKETERHRWDERSVDIEAIDRDAFLRIIRDAGIVGMGGATFPAHVKYAPLRTQPVDTLLVNGAECEPWLTCDHRVMLEHAREILAAVRIVQSVYSFETIRFGVEANKPDAVAALEDALREFPELPADVVTIAVKYPQGAEKMLIRALTGRIVPAGTLPLDAGVVVSNVATLNAVYEAFHLGKPVIDRVVTVSGGGVGEPANLRVPIGTPFEHVLGACGGIDGETVKVLVGGPMMGVAVPTLDYSVTKGSSGILCLTDAEIPVESPCIKCGRCVRACPMNLMPLKLAAYARVGDFERLSALDVGSCFECGACAFTCPAKIPIVAWIRYAKTTIRVKGR